MNLKKYVVLALSFLLLTGLLPVSAYAESADFCPESRTGEHAWSEPDVIEEATCQHPGTQIVYCMNCGYSYEETIPQLFHSYGDWVTIKEPTCTEEGVIKRTCTMCGGSDIQPLEKTDHDFGSQVVTKEATCTSTGTAAKTCVNCGYTVEETIPMTAHSYGSWQVTKEPTDFSAGTRVRTCVSCGDAQTQEFDPEGTLRRGDSGSEVTSFQEDLNAAGYDCGTADGVFGGMTEAAVSAFESDNDLPTDGVGWPGVQKMLKKEPGGMGASAPPVNAEGPSMFLAGDPIPVQNRTSGEQIDVTVTVFNNGEKTLNSFSFVPSKANDKVSHEPWMDGSLAPGEHNTYTYSIVLDDVDLKDPWGYRYASGIALTEEGTPVSATALLVFALPQSGASILLIPYDTTGMTGIKEATLIVPLYVFNNGDKDLTNLKFDYYCCGATMKALNDGYIYPGSYNSFFASHDSFIMYYMVNVVEDDSQYAALPIESGGGGGFFDRDVAVSADASDGSASVSDSCRLVFYYGQGEPDLVNLETLKIEKSVVSTPEKPEGYQEDETIEYKIVVTNITDSELMPDYTIYEIEVYDPLKGSNEDMLVGKIDKLGVGESAELTFTYTVTKEDMETKDFIENTAFATWFESFTDLNKKQYSNTVKVPLYKPAPVPPETPVPEEKKADVCMRVLNAKGHGISDYTLHTCETHWATQLQVDAMVSAAQTEEELTKAWTASQQLWKDQIDAMYQSLYDSGQKEEEKEIIKKEWDSFYELKDAFDASLELIYPDDPSQRAMKISEFLMNKCKDFCYEIHTAPHDRVDSYSREYAVLEDAPDSLACVRTIEEKAEHDVRYHENLSIDHATTEDMIMDLLKVGESMQDRIDVWQLARKYWELELNKLTLLRRKNTDDNGKAIIDKDTKTFEKWLKDREEFLNLLYPGRDDIISEMLAKTVMNRVLDYCEAMNSVG